MRGRNSTMLLCLLFMIGGPVTAAAENDTDGTVVENREYRFPAYDDVKGLARVCSRDEYNEAVKDTRYQMRRLVYLSDGLKVSALLYAPQNLTGSPRPLIIYNRGSYLRGDIAPETVVQFRRWAQEGFAVLAPLLRESDGMGGKDEVGGADAHDVLNAFKVAHTFEWVDEFNLFLCGESRGGMMTFFALRDGVSVRAAAVIGAITDLDAYLLEYPQLKEQVLDKIWPDFPERHDAYISSRSAIQWPEKISAPLLILHGGADGSVSPDQSLRLARALQADGLPYELHIIAGEDHILSEHPQERDRLVTNWFKAHLK